MMHEMTAAARERISAGQKRRHARERAEAEAPEYIMPEKKLIKIVREAIKARRRT